jgi:transcriptional regulator with XRE-family HTH domain
VTLTVLEKSIWFGSPVKKSERTKTATQNSSYNLSIQALVKQLLKKNNQSYLTLAELLGISESAVKQLMTKGVFTIDRIELIADWFGFSVPEFLEIALKAQSKPTLITAQQEALLLSNPVAIYVLFMLFMLGSGLTEKTILSKKPLSKADLEKALYLLDKAGFIELLPKNQIRMKTRAPYRFNKSGEVEKRLRPKYLKMVSELISASPDEDTFQRTFEMYLSAELLEQFKNDIQKMMETYGHLARIESEKIQEDQKFPVTGLVLVKPFDGWGALVQSLNKIDSSKA